MLAGTSTVRDRELFIHDPEPVGVGRRAWAPDTWLATTLSLVPNAIPTKLHVLRIVAPSRTATPDSDHHARPPMSYEGEILNACPSDIDFTNTWAVVVSGASWNPCGPMLFCCGTNSATSWYFQVAGQDLPEGWGIYAYPKFMRGDENYALPGREREA